MPKALFVQYTNPAGYPPLLHCMTVLMREGWVIASIGAGIRVTAELRMPPEHAVDARLVGVIPTGRVAQRIHYAHFCLRAAWKAAWWRPDLIYVSDMVAAPAGLLASCFARRAVIYHEHDSPAAPAGPLQKVLWRARGVLCHRALRAIAPNVTRTRLLVEQTGMVRDRALTVFNCPLADEFVQRPFAPKPEASSDSKFWLYYHGSIVPSRLPLAVVDALALLAPNVCLRVVGYVTPGEPGYVETLKARALELGVSHRVEFLGPISRNELLDVARKSHVGLSLMPMTSSDVNMVHMVGASNKPFEYLASGCPLIVSDLGDWQEMFVGEGVAKPCNPELPQSICDAVNYWLTRPEAYDAARTRALRKLTASWNYEAQFAPVLRAVRDRFRFGDSKAIVA